MHTAFAATASQPPKTGLLPLAAWAGDCSPSVSFFPTGGEDFNVPVAWGRTQQRKAGNPYTDQLFTVLLSSNNNLPGSFAAGVPTLQVLPVHPLLRLGATDVNATCRGYNNAPAPPPRAAAPAAADKEVAGPPSSRRLAQEPLAAVVTVPRVQITYVLNPIIVPDPPTRDPSDKFTMRYGAENATINPDMAEAEVAHQIAKLQELTTSRNGTVANMAREALQGYTNQQRQKAEEEEQIKRQEAALYTSQRWQQRTTPLRQHVMVGEFANLQPVPKIKLEGLTTLPDVS